MMLVFSEDSFPYKRYSMEPPSVYFKRAQAYRSQVEERVLRVSSDEARLLRTDSVISRTSRRAFLDLYPLHYSLPAGQPRRAVVIRTPRGAYDSINVLPDYYTEDARVRDTGAYETMSPYQFWVANKDRIEAATGGSDKLDKETLHTRREIIWKQGPKEARQGKITNILSLFALLKSRIVCDPSAAWGDRLIAALAAPSIMAYTGVDPHSRLPRGWREILDDLGPLSGKPNWQERFVMLNEPFEPEDATPLPEGMGNYDTVLISTAPLVGDQYDAGNPRQAVARHGASLRSYVVGFLVPYLKRCIATLKIGGHIAMTLLDRARDGYYITELQLLITELLMDGAMKFKNTCLWEGDSGCLVPWWIFVKSSASSRERRAEILRLFAPYSDIVTLAELQ